MQDPGPRFGPLEIFGRTFLRCSFRPNWYNKMWRRFEQRKVHRPKNSKQLRLARLEGQAHNRGALIRAGFRKDYFPYVEVKLRQRDQISFALPASGHRIH
jgi:hypothetical protein